MNGEHEAMSLSLSLSLSLSPSLSLFSHLRSLKDFGWVTLSLSPPLSLSLSLSLSLAPPHTPKNLPLLLKQHANRLLPGKRGLGAAAALKETPHTRTQTHTVVWKELDSWNSGTLATSLRSEKLGCLGKLQKYFTCPSAQQRNIYMICHCWKLFLIWFRFEYDRRCQSRWLLFCNFLKLFQYESKCQKLMEKNIYPFHIFSFFNLCFLTWKVPKLPDVMFVCVHLRCMCCIVCDCRQTIWQSEDRRCWFFLFWTRTFLIITSFFF